MSHEGKMLRGKEYSDSPEKIQGNTSRQADIDYYLENSKEDKKDKSKEKK